MQVCQLLGAGLGGGGHTHRADLAGGRGSWAGIPPRLEGEPHSDAPGIGSGVMHLFPDGSSQDSGDSDKPNLSHVTSPIQLLKA